MPEAVFADLEAQRTNAQLTDYFHIVFVLSKNERSARFFFNYGTGSSVIAAYGDKGKLCKIWT